MNGPLDPLDPLVLPPSSALAPPQTEELPRYRKLVLRFGALALLIHAVVLLVAAGGLALAGVPLKGVPIELTITAICASTLLTTGLLARYVGRMVSDVARHADRLAEDDFLPGFAGRTRNQGASRFRRSLDEMVEDLRGAQVELRNARSYVVRIIESMPEAVIVAERDDVVHLRICNLNRAAADMLGYAREQLVGQPLDTVLDDPAGARGLVQRLEVRTQFRGSDTRVARLDGLKRDVRVSASRVASGPDDAGHAVYVLVISDVEEERNNERRRTATYRLSELVHDAETANELLRGVESVLTGAIHIEAFHIAIVDDLIDKISIPYFSDPRLAEASVHEVTKGLTGYVISAEATVIMSAAQIRLLVQRGEVKAVEPVAEHWASAPIRLGGSMHGVIVVQSFEAARPFQSADVDLLAFAAEQIAAFYRRRHAEVERTRLSAAVEHAIDAVLIFTHRAHVAYCNPAFEKQTGFARAEVAGRTLDELWIPGDDLLPLDSIWSAVRAGSPWTGRISCARKDGTSFRVEATLSAVRNSDGAVVEFVVVQHDVSNELALEDQLRQAQKMEAIGMLAGGVAHDFNNILSVIQGYGEMARSNVTDKDTQGWIDEMIRSSERATDLVGQLLAFSRRQVIEPRPLALGSVVIGLENMLRRVIGEDIRLSVSIPPECDLVEADPGQTEQLVMNLVVNARDAMPEGGDLTISVRNADLDADEARLLPGLEPGPHVALSVADAGMGMSPEVQKRIFEPFYTTKPQGKGTGLGLSTVYGIVKQAGGHVGVTSEIGKGTEFVIYLPSIGRGIPQAEADESGEMGTGEETVLIVEDEAALRVFVHRILTRQGYTVFVAENGATALEISRGHTGPIDLLLTDVVMENMNGSTLAKAIVPDRPETAVLYMSGYPDSSIASYGVLDPDVDLLQKPFTSGRLLKRVRRALDAHRRRRKMVAVALERR